MATPLTRERALRLRGRLVLALATMAVLLLILWLAYSRLVGVLITSEELFLDAFARATRASRWVSIISLSVVGLAWAVALWEASKALWGPWLGTGAFVVAVALNRVVSVSTLVLAGVLAWRLTRAAASAPATARTAAAPRRGAGLPGGVAAGIVFLLPVAAALYTMYALWTGDSTGEWHWAVKIPVAVVLGMVSWQVATMVVMALVSLLGKLFAP